MVGIPKQYSRNSVLFDEELLIKYLYLDEYQPTVGTVEKNLFRCMPACNGIWRKQTVPLKQHRVVNFKNCSRSINMCNTTKE